jgi:antitoxin ParD1/3/4
MSTQTMSFALPEPMRDYIEQRVKSGAYGNTSEYLRELIRRDQDAQAKLYFQSLIAEGMRSGEAVPLTAERKAALRAQVLKKPAAR